MGNKNTTKCIERITKVMTTNDICCVCVCVCHTKRKKEWTKRVRWKSLYKNWNNKICLRQLINVAFVCKLFTHTAYASEIHDRRGPHEIVIHTVNSYIWNVSCWVDTRWIRRIRNGNMVNVLINRLNAIEIVCYTWCVYVRSGGPMW